MNEHEQQAEREQLEDLEPTAEQLERIAGGAVSLSDFHFTAKTDTSSPTLMP